MIIAVLSVSRGISTAARRRALALEASGRGVHAFVVDVPLQPLQQDPAEQGDPEGEKTPNSHRILARIEELEPDLVLFGCGAMLTPQALSLAGRLRRAVPGAQVLATGQGVWAEPDSWRRTVPGVVLSDDDNYLKILNFGPSSAASSAGSMGASVVAETARVVRGACAPTAALVEPSLGGGCRHWHHRCGVTRHPPRADPLFDEVKGLLAASLPTVLWHPAGLADDGWILRLLDRLPPGSARTLRLELPDCLLTSGLVDALLRTEVGIVDLELGDLAASRLPVHRLAPLLDRLQKGGVRVRGTAVSDAVPGGARLLQLVDRALACGVEWVATPSPVAPPDSVAADRAQQAGWWVDPRPPYQVWGSDDLSRGEAHRVGCVVELCRRLARKLDDTGLVRALARHHGTVTGLVEDFVEQIWAEGGDPLAESVDRPERRLLRHLGLDLEPKLADPESDPVLRRAAGMTLRWTADGRRELFDVRSGRAAQVGIRALEVLDRFSRPRQQQEVMRELSAKAPAEQRLLLQRTLVKTIDRLASLGFLLPVDLEAEDPVLPGEPMFAGLDEFDYHFRMLADHRRVEAYAEAIAHTVKPGQRVLDLGTGTGILAVLAARAGAQVTAVERYPVLDVARQVARSSGVADRIHFVRGNAAEIQLSHPHDLLVTELVGNRVLNEGLLEAVLDARGRLLTSDAEVIPASIAIHAELGYADRFDHVSKDFDRMGQRYGVNMDPLASWFEARLSCGRVVWEMGGDEPGFAPLSADDKRLDIDLKRVESVDLEHRSKVTTSGSGTVNAVALSFVLELAPGITLSTRGTHHLHWNKPVYLLPRPFEVRPGQSVTVTLAYEAHGDLTVRAETDEE